MHSVCYTYFDWPMTWKTRRVFTDTLASFSEDIVTSWRQRFRAINTGVFNVHNLDTRPWQQQFSGFCDKQGVVTIRIGLLR